MSTKENPLGTTWFKLLRWSEKIEEFTVTKSTSQTVWFRQRDWNGVETSRIIQERKGGDWYPTLAEAVAVKRKRLEASLQSANNAYSQAVKQLKDFNLKHAGRDGSPHGDKQP